MCQPKDSSVTLTYCSPSKKSHPKPTSGSVVVFWASPVVTPGLWRNFLVPRPPEQFPWNWHSQEVGFCTTASICWVKRAFTTLPSPNLCPSYWHATLTAHLWALGSWATQSVWDSHNQEEDTPRAGNYLWEYTRPCQPAQVKVRPVSSRLKYLPMKPFQEGLAADINPIRQGQVT